MLGSCLRAQAGCLELARHSQGRASAPGWWPEPGAEPRVWCGRGRASHTCSSPACLSHNLTAGTRAAQSPPVLLRGALPSRADGTAEGGGPRAAGGAERQQRRAQGAQRSARCDRAGECGSGSAAGRAGAASAGHAAAERVCVHRAQPVLARLCAPSPEHKARCGFGRRCWPDDSVEAWESAAGWHQEMCECALDSELICAAACRACFHSPAHMRIAAPREACACMT